MADQVVRVTNGSSLVVRTGSILGVGPSGPIGPQGPPGPTGIQGTVLFTTPAPPDSSHVPIPRTGDLWVNPTTGIISVYDASNGNWNAGTTNLKGPQGIQGIIGPTGATGPIGPAGTAANGFNTFNDLLPPGKRH